MDGTLHTRQTLLEKIRNQNNDKAWEDFVFYYRRYILGIIHRMEVPHHDVEDLAQQVILQAWKSLPEFQYDPGKGKFRNWLIAVTVNTVKRHFRKKSSDRNRIDSVSGMSTFDNVSLPEIEKKAEEEWQSYISQMAWSNIKASLAPKVCRAFELFIEGKAPGDIAAELELAENSVFVYRKRVKTLLFREIVRLENELG